MAELSARVGTIADYDEYVRLFAQLQIDDPIPSPDDWARDLAPHAIFLAQGDRTVAYAVAQPFGDEAHLLHVVVDGPMRGRGVGRELLLSVGERLRARGCNAVRLNVKVGNEPAIRLYASLGLDVHHRSAVIRLPWSSVARLGASDGVHVRTPAADEDETLGRRHDLIAGQVRSWRERGHGLVVAERAGRDVGFARYSVVGAMPFRAQGPAPARALLEAIRPHAPPAASHIQVVVEGQDDLAATLRDAGGVLLFEIFHMRGPVPGAIRAA